MEGWVNPWPGWVRSGYWTSWYTELSQQISFIYHEPYCATHNILGAVIGQVYGGLLATLYVCGYTGTSGVYHDAHTSISVSVSIIRSTHISDIHTYVHSLHLYLTESTSLLWFYHWSKEPRNIRWCRLLYTLDSTSVWLLDINTFYIYMLILTCQITCMVIKTSRVAAVAAHPSLTSWGVLTQPVLNRCYPFSHRQFLL